MDFVTYIYITYITYIFPGIYRQNFPLARLSLRRWRGDSIERAALFARSPRLLAKFDFIGKPPRRGGAASPAVVPSPSPSSPFTSVQIN